MTEKSTAIALPEQKDLQVAFEDGTISKLIDRVRKQVDEFKGDVSTAKGREEIKSFAHKIARSKKPLDDARKALTEEWRDKTSKVNAHWKDAESQLDELRDKAKKPVLEWEEREEKRKAGHMENMRKFNVERTNHEMTVAEIDAVIEEVKSITIDDSWDEFMDLAGEAYTDFMAAAEKNREFAHLRESQAEQIAQLQREKAERDKRDAEEREAREAEEREAREALDAKRVQDDLADSILIYIKQLGMGMIGNKPQSHAVLMYELEEKLPLEKSKLGDHWPKIQIEIASVSAQLHEAYEKSKAEAEEAERIAAEEREAMAKSQAETDAKLKLELERAAEEAAENKRASDANHRRQILSEIEIALALFDGPKEIALAMFDAKIPHVKVIL